MADIPQRQRRQHRYGRRVYNLGGDKHGQGKGSNNNNNHSRQSEFNVDPENMQRLSEFLKVELVRRNNFESEEGERRRQAVLEFLQKLLCDWSDSLLPPDTTSRPGVALCTFGSFRLGVHRPNADIDALALSPPHCTRGDFFTSLVGMLKSNPEVKNLHPVPSAYTPVIKFEMNGVPIDLVFAHLADGKGLLGEDGARFQRSAGEEFRIDDFHLVGLDEASVRSMNGVRVAQLLLKQVPHVDNFRKTLRAVKEWAIIHGLYSNVLGFLGGVNFAILVACICKHHPEDPPAALLYNFFKTFSTWKWPKPVRLVAAPKNPPTGVTPLPVWNPSLNPRDGSHLMPILTPTYPSMNSSYNVGSPQLRRIQQEMRRAEYTSASVIRGEKQWSDIFRQSEFFSQFIHYFQVNIIARNGTDFRSWFGLCESRLRILIVCLESPEYGIEAWPFAKFFHRKLEPQGGDEGNKNEDEKVHVSSFFIALKFAYGLENVDLQSCTSQFLYQVNSWEDRKYGMDLTIEHKLQQHLPQYVFSDEPKSDKQTQLPNNLEEQTVKKRVEPKPNSTRTATSPPITEPSPAKRAKNDPST